MKSAAGVDAPVRVAIQGELGSNSHMAALRVLAGKSGEIVPCSVSAEVFERLAQGTVDLAVLPIENSLHGSVFEHYDLLLDYPVTITGETTLHISHNVIAAPGVTLAQLKRVKSHPVALSQCRRWLRAHPELEVVPSYDTAGSVKEIIAGGLRDSAGIAPALAARQYGADILVTGIEDHPDNYTRFYVLVPTATAITHPSATKASLAFSVQHKPGSLIAALEALRDAGLNLTKIESRPIAGAPWEYVFFTDVRFPDPAALDAALTRLQPVCEMVRELGRYLASPLPA